MPLSDPGLTTRSSSEARGVGPGSKRPPMRSRSFGSSSTLTATKEANFSMSQVQHYVRLKAAVKDRIEVQVGDIHISANAGQTVKADQRQYQVAIASGFFV